MANKKLFENFSLATPSDSDRLAFGKSGEEYKNITVGDFRAVMIGETTLKTLVFEIGAWNMNINEQGPAVEMIISDEGEVPLYIPMSKVRTINVLIHNDSQGDICDFLSVQNGTDALYPQIRLGGFMFTTYVSLLRRAGSFFDSISYQKTVNPDTTPFNRGFVTVTYVE